MRVGINTGKTTLSGPEARALMRLCRVTIRDAATRAKITMKRVRQVRRRRCHRLPEWFATG